MALALLIVGIQMATACPDRIDLIEQSHQHLLSAE